MLKIHSSKDKNVRFIHLNHILMGLISWDYPFNTLKSVEMFNYSSKFLRYLDLKLSPQFRLRPSPPCDQNNPIQYYEAFPPLVRMYCSKTSLTGETPFHRKFLHPWDPNDWPPRQEANSWPTGLVRLCIGVKLQGIYRAPPQQPDQGSNRSLCCKEEEDLQGVEWNCGRHAMCKATGFSHWLAQSLVKHPLKGGEATVRITLGSPM